MSVANQGGEGRSFTFDPTPAVVTSRARTHYVSCPVCTGEKSEYLFHRGGVRFVRCTSCSLVYVNPVGAVRANYFDIDRSGQYAGTPRDRALAVTELDEVLQRIEKRYLEVEGKPLKRVALLGRYMKDFAETETARRVGLSFVEIDDAVFKSLVLDSDVSWAKPLLDKQPQVVFLKELLEACSDPSTVMQRLRQAAPASAWWAVDFSNVRSLPAVMLRRYWSRFFDYKSTFFDLSNLNALMARSQLQISTQFPYPTRRTLEYVLGKFGKASLAAPARHLSAPLRTGHQVALYAPQPAARTTGEKLSIVMPIFNEARYAAQVIEGVLAKQIKIDRELIIVESNSTDGTREIVRGFEGREGVRVVYEEKPRGKGHAVRTGLKAAKGTIILIQDADFEYDVDDYDALLEPILQHQTSFVLGSRTLGIGDWKVRKFATGHTKAFLLNFAQLVFAQTFNALYQQRITDVNTMYKVFRTEALQGMDLESDGFELDIELACKLVRTGNTPIEVPVNYVARGFDEGKKIRFFHDSWVSYFAFFKHRFE